MINQYTRYGTVGLAALQAYGIAIGLEHCGNVVIDPGWFFRISTVITLTGGTMLLMWLGEQITSRGVGNGISLIIFAGIVARFPTYFGQIFESARTGAIDRRSPSSPSSSAPSGSCCSSCSWSARSAGCWCNIPSARSATACSAAVLASAAQAQRLRRHPADLRLVDPPDADDGRRFNAQNVPGWMQTLLDLCEPRQPLYLILYGLMIIFFAFFYTSIIFNPDETAENLKNMAASFPESVRQEDGGIYRLCADAHDGDRRDLSGDRLPDPRIHAPQVTSSLLSGRHLDPHHRQRDDGYDCANPEPSDCAAI